MKNTYTLILGLACALISGRAQAQYTFTDGNLSPYQQNFDALTGTVAVTDNYLTAIPEVYAQAEFGTPPATVAYSPASFGANDGSNAAANYYHFGYASGAGANDRALGGIAATTTADGIGYVGVRLKNGSSNTIKNLEIKYAMEQWYNSTRIDQARVSVSYLLGVQPVAGGAYTPVTSLIQGTNNWVTIPALAVDAPSTATLLAGRDGNAASNRRVSSTTVPGINLAPGQEIMIRWAYTLNNTTNGNGLSIDDVMVTPETNVFYSKTVGDLNDLATWGQSTDGSGTAPTSFTANDQIFYVQSPGSTSASDRIGVANTTLGTVWTVSGLNSKIIVGTPTSAAGLAVNNSKNIEGAIDVGNNSYFQHNHPTNPAFTFGTLAATSTVEYNQSSLPIAVQANQYGTLKFSGTNVNRNLNRKELSGNIVVVKTLAIFGGTNVLLGNYDLTVLSGGTVTGGAGTYVVTNGTGRLRVSLPRASSSTVPGALRTFPVGSSVTSYTPVTLQQTSTISDDVFEVRVLDGVSRTYDATTYAPGPVPITTEAVNKTWLISKEVPVNPATVNMSLQWNTGETTSDFVSSRAHINHYTGGEWDIYMSETGTGSTTGPFVATRLGVTGFSPFSVSSRANGALPVELLSFDAKRTGPTVACAWATASEHNNDHFTVERSADGEAFVAIGRVKGAGSTSKAAQYAFVDQTPLTGAAYYRLRQVDFDGMTSFSPVVLVQGTSFSTKATAVPNPSAGRFDIWTLAADVTATEVTTLVGAKVVAQPTTAPSGFLTFDLSAQPAGVYLVHIRTQTGSQVVRVVKN